MIGLRRRRILQGGQRLGKPQLVCTSRRDPRPRSLVLAARVLVSLGENEHRAARERVIVMDMSFMGKFLVQGRDAGRSLDLISAGNVDGPVGRITYTPWLNEHGLLEADLTVSKISEDAYLVVVTDTMVRHAHTWMKRQFPARCACDITDVTSGLCVSSMSKDHAPGNCCNPSLAVDLSNAAFPFRTVREIDIGFARVLVRKDHLRR